ncbi:hypothetical protein [Roseospira goensis]|uniref:FeoB-associated Cys-rich membrane protein n=1 Tax=Roseospira goensis TaxID=391922 RepID=A0A7W6S039_9PROT|nr:hypothetical protein [Roseospira goensis]MBB4285925.1 hypothetical protein [Roseospira goensis]
MSQDPTVTDTAPTTVTTPVPTTAADPAPPAVDLSEEAVAGGLELLLVGGLVAVALLYLWRTWFGRKRSPCSSCASGKTCAVARQAEALRRDRG